MKWEKPFYSLPRVQVHWFYKSGLRLSFLVVDIEIFNFFLVAHVLLISQDENGAIIIPKTVLKSGLWRGKQYASGNCNFLI